MIMAIVYGSSIASAQATICSRGLIRVLRTRLLPGAVERSHQPGPEIRIRHNHSIENVIAQVLRCQMD